MYKNDEVFKTRSLPRYYHVTKPKFVVPIVDSMEILFGNATYTGAWFANGSISLIIVQS